MSAPEAEDVIPVETKNETPEADEVIQERDNRNRDFQRTGGNRPSFRNTQIHEATFADLLEPFPQFSDIPTMKREFGDIAQFGSRSKNAAVKNNIKKATDMAFELIKYYSALSKQSDSFTGNEKVFKQLKEEYAATTQAYGDLTSHLESLVTQLTAENNVLKDALKVEGIEIPSQTRQNDNGKK
uniref:Uncharacterized protein n=1 Tax=Vannella robusta TaxID=1487602 RepID=A0A7S4IQI4_9EUKA